jgi:hypothetical protein
MLKANKDNSLEIMESSYIKLSNEGIIMRNHVLFCNLSYATKKCPLELV